MTDLEIAKNNLAGHTICLCKNGECIYSDKRGIAPMMGFIAEGVDLAGCSVADKVVGRAAALLFVKCGISAVFGRTLSKGGKEVLEKNGITVEYEAIADKIINRDGTDICPMEKAVGSTENPDEAYELIKAAVEKLRAKA